MDFFDRIFNGLVGLAEKLPAADVGSYYLVTLLFLALTAVVIGLTFFGSHAAKFSRACRKIMSYLANVAVINDDNAADFTAECFGAKVPGALRETWTQYLGIRFGYPSEIISDSAVFDKEVKRHDSIRANVYISIALILVAFFAFWGLGCMGDPEIGVVLCLGLLISALGYLALTVVAKKIYKKAREDFYALQDELDAKVNLQVEKEYAADASPLLEIASVLDAISARNTARPYPDLADMAGASEKRSEQTAENEESDAVRETEDDSVARAEAVVTLPVEEEAQVSEESVAEDEESGLLTLVREAELGSAQSAEESVAQVAEADAAVTETEESASEALQEEVLQDAASDSVPDTEDVSPREGVPVRGENDGFVETGEDDGNVASFLEYRAGLEEAAFAQAANENDMRATRSDYVSEEITDEDEENMFGRKKKKARQDELTQQGYSDLIVEGELLDDEEGADAVEGTLVRRDTQYATYAEPASAEVATAVAEQPASQASASASAQSAPARAIYGNGTRPESLEGLNVASRPVAASAIMVSLEPEVIYVEEDLDEGDENVKAPRLAPMPHLVDYVLTMNLSRSMKIKVAMLMLQAYNVFKNSPENKAIVIQCLSKIIKSIMADQAAVREQAAATVQTAEPAVAEPVAEQTEVTEEVAESAEEPAAEEAEVVATEEAETVEAEVAADEVAETEEVEDVVVEAEESEEASRESSRKHRFRNRH